MVYIMKNTRIQLAILACLSFFMLSCSNIDLEDIELPVITKADDATIFANAVVSTPSHGDLPFTTASMEESAKDGLAYLFANTGGKMSDEMLFLSIAFDDKDLDHVLFMMPCSNDSRDMTDESNGGSFIVHERDDSHFLVEFKKLTFALSDGDYILNGYVKYEKK